MPFFVKPGASGDGGQHRSCVNSDDTKAWKTAAAFGSALNWVDLVTKQSTFFKDEENSPEFTPGRRIRRGKKNRHLSGKSNLSLGRM
jgi:hypothetical protein